MVQTGGSASGTERVRLTTEEYPVIATKRTFFCTSEQTLSPTPTDAQSENGT